LTRKLSLIDPVDSLETTMPDFPGTSNIPRRDTGFTKCIQFHQFGKFATS
jgi:hypothetical protein